MSFTVRELPQAKQDKHSDGGSRRPVIDSRRFAAAMRIAALRDILPSMRFSIRWLLAVTAYLALLAATIGTTIDFLVDLLWAVPILAFCYATMVACIDRGKRQAMAIGFVALSAAYVVCMYLAPTNVPAMRLYSAAGYVVSSDGEVYEVTGGATTVGEPRLSRAFRRAQGLIPSVRTSNAVATLVVGLIGCYIGLLAYKNANRA
jgi:hypothetical protein